MRYPAFSLCMPYHNNPGMLFHHWAHIAALPEKLRHSFEVVICDDASDQPAFVPDWDEKLSGVHIEMLRIPPPHIPWSHRVATNIAVSNARGAWVLVTDIDHVVPRETWEYLTSGYENPFLKTDRAFRFERRNADGTSYKSHPDSWLMHISVWTAIKGYDERYRGHYGQNMPFVDRVQHHVKIDTLPVPLIRYSRDDIPDASERFLTRKTPHARQSIATMRTKFFREGTFYADTRGSQPYTKVTR